MADDRTPLEISNERAALIEPLREFVDTDAFKTVVQQVESFQFNFSGEPSVFPHLSGIIATMNGLKLEVARWPVHQDEAPIATP